MMKKLVVVVMAVFFSISVAGLSFADEPKAAAPAAEKAAPAPAGKEMKGMEMKEDGAAKKAPKRKKKAAKKTEEKKEEAAPAPAPAPAPAKK